MTEPMASMNPEQRDLLIGHIARALVDEQGQGHPDPYFAIDLRRTDADIMLRSIEQSDEWRIVWLNPEGITA